MKRRIKNKRSRYITRADLTRPPQILSPNVSCQGSKTSELPRRILSIDSNWYVTWGIDENKHEESDQEKDSTTELLK